MLPKRIFSYATIIFHVKKAGVLNLLSSSTHPHPHPDIDICIEGGANDGTLATITTFDELKNFVIKHDLTCDAVKAWYENDRWKTRNIDQEPNTYIDPGIMVIEGENKKTISLCDYLTNFSNIPSQIDIPLKPEDCFKLSENTKIEINLHDDEKGKLILFFSEGIRENRNPGIPTTTLVVEKTDIDSGTGNPPLQQNPAQS